MTQDDVYNGSEERKVQVLAPSPFEPRELFRRAVALISVLLLLTSVTLLIAYSLFWIYKRYWYKEEVIVPQVTGLPLQQAVRIIYLSELTPEVSGYVESELPEMRVAKQVPVPGMKLIKGRKVHLFLSLGREGIKMPDLFGKRLEEVIDFLKQANIRYTVYKVSTNLVPPGVILDQIPAPGRPVTPGTNISLFASVPPERVRLENVLGESLIGVRDLLRKRNYEVYEVSFKKVGDEPFSNLEVADIYLKDEMASLTVMMDYSEMPEMKEVSLTLSLPPTESRVKVELVQRDYLGVRSVFKGYLKGPQTMKLTLYAFGRCTVDLLINDELKRRLSLR